MTRASLTLHKMWLPGEIFVQRPIESCYFSNILEQAVKRGGAYNPNP